MCNGKGEKAPFIPQLLGLFLTVFIFPGNWQRNGLFLRFASLRKSIPWARNNLRVTKGTLHEGKLPSGLR